MSPANTLNALEFSPTEWLRLAFRVTTANQFEVVNHNQPWWTQSQPASSESIFCGFQATAIDNVNWPSRRCPQPSGRHHIRLWEPVLVEHGEIDPSLRLR